MKRVLGTTAVFLITAAPAFAGGIDRSGQPIGVIFEEADNYFELSYGRIRPEVDGRDLDI